MAQINNQLITVCISIDDYGDIDVIEKIKGAISKLQGFRYFISTQYVKELLYDIYVVGDSAADIKADIEDDELLMAYIRHIDIKLM